MFRFLLRLTLILGGAIVLLITALTAIPRRGVETPPSAWIIYKPSPTSREESLFRSRPDGSNPEWICNLNTGFTLWSPDGQWLATNSSTSSSAIISRMRPNSTQRERLTDVHGLSYLIDWSPDSQWILFTSGNRGLYRMRADGTDSQMLLDSMWVYDPLWAPNGDWIIFRSDPSGIYRIRPSGSDLRHIAYNGRYGKEALSPDGEWLVLEVNRGIRESLYVLRTNGSELNLLTDYPQDIRNSPAWSPDGEWIIFSSVVNGGTSGDTNIYRIRPNGSELQQITHLSNDYVEFKWTPDGHWITFRSGTFAGNSETYQIRSDGSDLHRVPYYILQATWGPPLKDTYRPAIPILIGGMMLIIGITPWKHLLRCLFRSTFKEIFSKPIGRCLHGQFKPE